MFLADALSRAYLPNDESQKSAVQEFESVNMMEDTRKKPTTKPHIRAHTEQDEVLQELMKVIKAGWPDTKQEISHLTSPFFGIRDKLSASDGIILRGERVVISRCLRCQLTDWLHYTYTGVVSALATASKCMYWQGMNADAKHVETCDVCPTLDRKLSKKTCIPHEAPDLHY